MLQMLYVKLSPEQSKFSIPDLDIAVKDHPNDLIDVKQTALHRCHYVCSRLQPEPGASRRRRVPVLLQPRGEHFLPGGQLRPQPEPHVVRLHRDIEQHWSRVRFTTPTPQSCHSITPLTINLTLSDWSKQFPTIKGTVRRKIKDTYFSSYL